MNLLVKVVLLLSTLVFELHPCESQNITVYSDYDYEGESANIDVTNCSHLPVYYISSVKFNAECIRLYGNFNCSGQFMEITSRSPIKHFLPAMDNIIGDIKSAGPCTSPCSEMSRQNNTREVMVDLFDGEYFEGSKYNLKVQGCTDVPMKLKSTKSIRTNGHCIQLYNTANCLLQGPDADTIVLGHGTPFHSSLYYFWNFKTVKTISLCNYHCIKSESDRLPLTGEVTIYYNKSLNWYFNKINVSSGGCFSMGNYANETVISIRTGEQTCVSLFTKQNCQGNRYNANESIENFSKINFDQEVASISRCATNNMSVDVLTTRKLIITTTSLGIRETTSEVIMQMITETDQTTTHNIQQKEIGSDTITIVVIIAVVVVCVCLTVVTVAFIRYRKNNGLERHLEKDIQTFISGLEMDILTTKVGMDNNSKDYSTEILAQNKPYSREFEISRSRIEIDSRQPLGMGEFGVVYKGTVTLLPPEQSLTTGSDAIEKIPVAIKTAKPDSDMHGLRSLLKEVKVMLYMGRNPHIAYLVGCCTENLRDGEIMVLMEFCAGGSIESFFTKNRASFVNLVIDGRLGPTHSLQTRSNFLTPVTNEDVQFDTLQLFKWCVDIARGMEFLSNAKIVHSDLAARNILLTENLHAKISDFGLSRQLYNYSQYMKKKREPLPWRWMSIESLKYLEFSTKSDVWSYGVLCWEMFNLGQKPYSNLAWDNDFVVDLENGLRLSKPNYSTDELYGLMRQCWAHDSKLRPDFTELVYQIQKMGLSSPDELLTTS